MKDTLLLHNNNETRRYIFLRQERRLLGMNAIKKGSSIERL